MWMRLFQRNRKLEPIEPGRTDLVVLSGFEPESPAPKASMIDHYTTGL